jgi:hypothetical protein
VGIFDLAGREVARPVDGPQTAGRHTATWGGSPAGAAARSGVYFARYETPAGTWTTRVVRPR